RSSRSGNGDVSLPRAWIVVQGGARQRAHARAAAHHRLRRARRGVRHSRRSAFRCRGARSLGAMQTLLNLLAGVSLLVWGPPIVRVDILRLFGGSLRRFLRVSVANPVRAFFAGVGITALIQSSTATAVIVASFAGQSLIGTAQALAVMLG